MVVIHSFAFGGRGFSPLLATTTGQYPSVPKNFDPSLRNFVTLEFPEVVLIIVRSNLGYRGSKTYVIDTLKNLFFNLNIRKRRYRGRIPETAHQTVRNSIGNWFDSTKGFPGEGPQKQRNSGAKKLTMTTWNTRSLTFDRLKYCENLGYDIMVLRFTKLNVNGRTSTKLKESSITKGPSQGEGEII